MKIEVSNGEIIDKLTIIQIKLERIKEKGKLVNLQKEYSELFKASSCAFSIRIGTNISSPENKIIP